MPEPSADEADAWDDSPEGIADWLAWADSLEPLIFTDAKRAAWEAWEAEQRHMKTAVV